MFAASLLLPSTGASDDIYLILVLRLYPVKEKKSEVLSDLPVLSVTVRDSGGTLTHVSDSGPSGVPAVVMVLSVSPVEATAPRSVPFVPDLVPALGSEAPVLCVCAPSISRMGIY